MKHRQGAPDAMPKATTIPLDLLAVRRAVNDYLDQRGLEPFYDVAVKKDGIWFEFSGRIDSQWTRAILFSLVPKQAGCRFVIDNLMVDSFLEEDMAS